MPGSLDVPIRPRPSGRSKMWRILAILGAVALVGGWTYWYVTTPDELPTSDRVVVDQGIVGTPLYVGMFAAPGDFDRTLHISAVNVPVDGEADVVPMLCRDGGMGVTTEPDQYCSDLVEPAGEELSAGDSIAVAITAAAPATVRVDRIELSFREGLTWGTEDAGNRGAEISIVDRPAG